MRFSLPFTVPPVLLRHKKKIIAGTIVFIILVFGFRKLTAPKQPEYITAEAVRGDGLCGFLPFMPRINRPMSLPYALPVICEFHAIHCKNAHASVATFVRHIVHLIFRIRYSHAFNNTFQLIGVDAEHFQRLFLLGIVGSRTSESGRRHRGVGRK
ncbi:hypothetical protein EXS70_00595 [Candidatus Peribacteria bacterium]|nr:hypothetical protein [Candidatus Peribacteria bacterium]